MKHVRTVVVCLVLVMALAVGSALGGTVKSAGVKGLWNVPATWTGGVLPGATDTAIIADGDSVTYNMGMALNTTVAKLVIGEGTSGVLLTNKADSSKLIVKTDLVIKSGAWLKAQSNTLTSNVRFLIELEGNFQCDGSMDARTGSAGTSLGVVDFTFAGSTNTTITFATDPATLPANYEFNGITINKSGNANVYLGSNIICASGSSSAANHSALLAFVRGKVFTGNYTFITTTTTGANYSGYSDSSYVVGAFGRGTSSGGGTREYYVGDAQGYRPITIRTTTGNGGTGNYVIVRLVSGNANTGSSTLGAGIDKVSSGRYYQISWNKGITGTTSATFDVFTPSYRNNDGIVAGSVNARAALSTDNRVNWKNLGPTTITYTVLMDSLPRRLPTDTLLTTNLVTVNSGEFCYVALARKAGTTDNTLDPPATAVEHLSEVPNAFALGQNYPNPFNPSTTIEYSLPQEQPVTVKVFSLLGQEVATLVSTVQPAGTYRVTFDASSLTSGMYVYQVRAGALVQSRRMMLLK